MTTIDISDERTRLVADATAMLTTAHTVIQEQNRLIAKMYAAIKTLMDQPTMNPLDMTPEQRGAFWSAHAKAREALALCGSATVRCDRCCVSVPMAALADPARCADQRCPLKPQE